MRFKHVLKPVKRLVYPQRLIFLDSEASIEEYPEAVKKKTIKAEKHVFKIASACYVQLDENLNIVKEEWVNAGGVEEIHEFIVKHARANSSLFVFAHNFHYDFPILQLYKLTSYGFELKKAVFESDVFFMKLKDKRRAIIYLVDSTNFFKTSIKELGELLKLEKLEIDFKTASEEELKIYNMRDVEILKQTIISFLRFLKEHSLPFRITLAGTAFASFRSRFMNHKIIIHDNSEIEELERNSYYGGRNEAFRIGEVKNVYVYDFNSLYPYVMKTYKVPVKLLSVYESVSVEKALELLNDDYLLISEAWIETDKAYYPYRFEKKDKLIFPQGRFKTFLTTPELKIALTNNHVKKLGLTAIYQGEKIFEEYVNFFYNLRLKYKSEGNQIYQHMAKILMNSLYGKFAQRVRELKAVREIDADVFEVEDIYLADKEKRIIYKRVMGKEFVLEESEKLSYNSFTAIASHITAYARTELLKAIEIAGWDNVYYVDTDSIFTNKQGAKNLEKANLIDDKKLGKLKLEYVADKIIIHGCKDYTAYVNNNVVEKIKGVNKKAAKLSENKYLTLRFNRFNSLLRKKSKNAVIVEYVVKELLRNYDKGIVREDGRVEPFRLWLF